MNLNEGWIYYFINLRIVELIGLKKVCHFSLELEAQVTFV